GAQYFARGESLDCGETGGAQEQPRWHRGAGGGGGGRPAAAARAGGWVGLSVGQRSAAGFRGGRGGEGGKPDGDLAGRWQAGGGEPAGGPRDHHRGEVADGTDLVGQLGRGTLWVRPIVHRPNAAFAADRRR